MQHLRDGARDLRYLEGMRQAGAVVIAGRREEDLCLVLQATKRFRVNDTIAIALKCRPDVVFRLGSEPTFRIGGLRRFGSQEIAFAGFELMAD
jgi:hypothetical protein